MNRAIELARRAEGRTSPNPIVGAVVVKDGDIIGEGFHRRAGHHHAEIEALGQAGDRAKGATVYVTLEPCCVYGRTPPCTEALIKAEVDRVVYGVRDPNPEVDGRGHLALELAGIEVLQGVCEQEAKRLIRAFGKVTREGLPLVTAKFAMSLDGKIATRTGHSKWISCQESRRFAHQLRHLSDAIVVGAGTVTIDNPRLTTRLEVAEPNHPLRIVVDSRGRCPIESEVFSAALAGETVLASTDRIDRGFAETMGNQGVSVWRLPQDGQGHVDIEAMLKRLAAEGCLTVLVEGGSGLLGSFFERGLVDRALVSVAPKIVGGVDAPGPVGGLGIEHMKDALEFGETEIELHGVDLWIRAEQPRRAVSSE